MDSRIQRDWHALKGWQVAFLFFVIWLVAGVMSYYVVPRDLSPAENWSYRALFAQSVTAGLFSVVVLLSRPLRQFAFEACHRPGRPISWLELAAALVLMFLWVFGGHRLIVASAIVHGDTSYWYTAFGFSDSVEALRDHHVALTFLISVLVAPILEEFVFRAVMLRVWMQSRSLWLSVAFSSIAFGAIHNTSFLFATAAGVLFACLYLSYRSILPAVLVHAAHNLIVLIPAVRQSFSLRDQDVVSSWSGWTVEFLSAILMLPLAFWVFRRLVSSPLFPAPAANFSARGES